MKLNYARLQRMHFIDFIVDHYGFIQRKHLMDYFGIASAQATRDITMYREQWPDNLEYAVVAKSWAKGSKFKRVFSGLIEPDTEE